MAFLLGLWSTFTRGLFLVMPMMPVMELFLLYDLVFEYMHACTKLYHIYL